MKTTGFQSLRVYELAEQIADAIWHIVRGWDRFAMDTVGKQIVRSADSIGANIAEGSGRQSFAENKRFIHYARGSLTETQHWLRRAYNRKLLTNEQITQLKELVAELAPKLNAYRNSIGKVRPPKPLTQGGAPPEPPGPMTNDN